MYCLDYALEANNSASMKRNPAPKENLVRGSTSYIPFLPGGLDPTDLIPKKKIHTNDDLFPLDRNDLLTAAPGMDRGLVLQDLDSENIKEFKGIQNVVDLDLDNNFLKDLLQSSISEDEELNKKNQETQDQNIQIVAESLEAQAVDDLIPILVNDLF